MYPNSSIYYVFYKNVVELLQEEKRKITFHTLKLQDIEVTE